MPDRAQVLDALAPVLAVVKDIDPAAPDAAEKLNAAFPVDGDAMKALAALLKDALAEGAVGDRENGGVKFSRVKKAADDDISVDFVHMSTPGPGHTHPNGEMDLCFVHDGAPTFDGNPPGWTVYPPGSWHVPTVSGGTMDILYFLPGGAIEFGPRPG